MNDGNLHNNYQWGLHDNKLVHISEVVSGLKCDCKCPYCNESFVAYKGKKNAHHFKHHSGKTCKYSFETALHLLAKEIIAEKKFLNIPALYYNVPGYMSLVYDFRREALQSGYFVRACQEKISFDSIEVEKYNGEFKPDLKCKFNDTVISVEITVTHGIDDKKLEKIKSSNSLVLEVDLSSLYFEITRKELERILYSPSTIIKWVANNPYMKQHESYVEIFDLLRTYLRKIAKRKQLIGNHIHNCPLEFKHNVVEGKYCSTCKYGLDYIDDVYNGNYVICSGHKQKDVDNLLQQIDSDLKYHPFRK